MTSLFKGTTESYTLDVLVVEKSTYAKNEDVVAPLSTLKAKLITTASRHYIA